VPVASPYPIFAPRTREPSALIVAEGVYHIA
jgi:hypothetical protein